jgi:O-antigen ligase
MLSSLWEFLAGRLKGDNLLVDALGASLLFSMISISLAQGFLAIALIVWIVLLLRGKRRFEVPPFFWALTVYAGLSLLSSAASVNPKMSFWDSRDLLLLLAVPIVLAAVRRRADIRVLLAAILISAVVNGLYAIGYQLLKASPGERVKAFMSHYMTQAGIAALFFSFALGFLIAGFIRRPGNSPEGHKLLPERIAWGAGLLLASAAILLTLTRGAWIGVGAALIVVIFIWKPKALVVLPLLAVIGFIVAPKSIKDRAMSIFTLRDESNIARVQYFKAGMKIIADYPLLGTGPDTVDMVFQDPKYGLGIRAKHNVHLHSNPIQIAAERGVVTLLAWLAFIGLAFAGLWKIWRAPVIDAEGGTLRRKTAIGALAALTAFFVAGFFEYNFGDSEIAQLLLILLALPFAARHIENAATCSDQSK